MKKVFTLVLLLVIMGSCNNKQTNTKANSTSISTIEQSTTDDNNEEYLNPKDMSITDEEWQKIIENYESIIKRFEIENEDEDSEGTIELTEEDFVYGEWLANKMMKNYSWVAPSESIYLKRVREVLGIDLKSNRSTMGNRLIKRKDYTVYVTPQFFPIQSNNEINIQYYNNKKDYYLYAKDGLIFSNSPSTFIYITKNEKDEYVLKNAALVYYYHLNNYIFYGNKASLTWLINNDDGTLTELFTMFGHDKEDAINTRILDKADNKHLENTFASRDIYGDLDIREGLFETVTKHSTKEFNDYYSLLQDYGYSISEKVDDKIDREKEKMHKLFTQAERRKILAHVFNTLQPIYDKYNQQCLNGQYGVLDKFGIGIEDSFWNICFDDRELIKDFEVHDCYGLPFLKSFLEKLRKDSKFVNPENGELEPWIYNPWDVHPDEDGKSDAK